MHGLSTAVELTPSFCEPIGIASHLSLLELQFPALILIHDYRATGPRTGRRG